MESLTFGRDIGLTALKDVFEQLLLFQAVVRRIVEAFAL